MFKTCAVPILNSVLEGYNGTIFAYGQTGTGKTWTMEGEDTEANKGLTPRRFRYIFETIDKTESTQYLVRASMLELYNENINDLLDPAGKNLNIREDKETGFYVQGLSNQVVHSEEELKKIMLTGQANRVTAATGMNAVSLGLWK